MEYRPKVSPITTEPEQEEATTAEPAPEKKPKRKNNKKDKETKENKDSNLPLGAHSQDLQAAFQ
jgi:hypothetical protein